MTWSPLQLRDISLLGPNKKTSSLKFRNGLNVICGSSDTGKSFVIEAIDFFLGGNDPLRGLPERVGYNLGSVSIETNEEDLYTITRSVDGGKFKLYDGSVESVLENDKFEVLKEKHAEGKEDNLSGWFLARIGLLNKRLKKNQNEETRSLSFRDIARLVIIQEEEIIRRSSPFLTGQFVNKTVEKNVLKLLLTGIDDSALVAINKKYYEDSAETKIELISQWLTNLHDELDNVSDEKEELESQIKKLNKSIDEINDEFDTLQKDLDNKLLERRELVNVMENIKDRVDEINDLESRFSLLDEHYSIDLERLEAVEESGTLFYYESPSSCPLCGAKEENQHRKDFCEGDVENIVLAAKNEKSKIIKLSGELIGTIETLTSERSALETTLEEHVNKYKEIDELIKETLTPNLNSFRSNYKSYYETKTLVSRDLDIYLRIEKLEKQRNELAGESVSSNQVENNRTFISKAVLDEFSQKIESILKAWNFPNPERVHFDEQSMDFVIQGKPRGSTGKGLRAITHAAVTIGLLEFCKDKSLPHPGFVILDSPLLAYWKPEGSDDSLVGSDLKEKFYDYLVNNHQESQIILFENEHPNESLLSKINLTIFTKNPNAGRFGFLSQISD